MTVTQLNLQAKSLLEAHLNNITLQGEISKITLHNSGHWYFELKDEKSSISCAMFKNANLRVNFRPKVGDFLELNGSVSLYHTSGSYQFIAQSMKIAGFGDLEAKFLALKEKLEKEGLFDISLKKPLPRIPLKIGIISSFTSAALEDMLKIITHKANFLAKFYIFNALTQGSNAPQSLIKALLKADEFKLDAIVLARGGGSREDLFCFNDESLARAIFAAKTPIISAIGHEIDYVISDFVADLRAPTPSAAIDLLLLSREDLEQELDNTQLRLDYLFKNKLEIFEKDLMNLSRIYKANSLNLLITQKLKLNENLKNNLKFAMKNQLNLANFKFEKAYNAFLQHESFFEKSKALISLKKDGKIVSLNELKKGDEITLHSQSQSKIAQILS